MKAAPDSMMWVSYAVHANGWRHRLIERAIRAKVRLFVSEYILQEVGDALHEDFGESRRFVRLARDAILRRTHLVGLPPTIRSFVPGDPKDDAIVQTALSAKADYIVTADLILLKLGKVHDVEIIDARSFAELLPLRR